MRTTDDGRCVTDAWFCCTKPGCSPYILRIAFYVLAWGPLELATAEDVEMQVVNALPGVGAGIHDDPVAALLNIHRLSDLVAGGARRHELRPATRAAASRPARSS